LSDAFFSSTTSISPDGAGRREADWLLAHCSVVKEPGCSVTPRRDALGRQQTIIPCC
jgi:hypothetical protein